MLGILDALGSIDPEKIKKAGEFAEGLDKRLTAIEDALAEILGRLRASECSRAPNP